MWLSVLIATGIGVAGQLLDVQAVFGDPIGPDEPLRQPMTDVD
jgi:hypothetical protein